MNTMSKETKKKKTQKETHMTENTNEGTHSNGNMVELLKAVYHNGIVALKQFFDEVSGQVLNQESYGPIFVFQIRDADKKVYACGFFLQELVSRFQAGNDPAQWMASFFFDLMKNEEGKPLPDQPASEEETKAFIDRILVPHCIEAVRREFALENIHAGLGFVPGTGPVFEAGFRAIKDGNNVCAIPLHILLTHWHLNRDPADILIEGLYNIRKQHGLY